MNQYSKLAAMVVFGVIGASPVHAEWYLGADQILNKDWYNLDDYSIDTTTINDSDSNYQDSGIKLYSGYKASDLYLC